MTYPMPLATLLRRSRFAPYPDYSQVGPRGSARTSRRSPPR
jgi:hypothetical protein